MIMTSLRHGKEQLCIRAIFFEATLCSLFMPRELWVLWIQLHSVYNCKVLSIPENRVCENRAFREKGFKKIKHIVY